MEQNQEIKVVNKDDRTWAMLCHLSALAGFIIPFGSVLGPLIIWLIKKDEMPIVDVHGKKALNFQITMAIAYFVCLKYLKSFISNSIFLFVAISNIYLLVQKQMVLFLVHCRLLPVESYISFTFWTINLLKGNA